MCIYKINMANFDFMLNIYLVFKTEPILNSQP